MTEEHMNKRSIFRGATAAGVIFIALMVLAGAAILAFNNVSFFSSATFAKRVDIAIESSEKWVEEHREDILKKKNIALLKMLDECGKLGPNPVFEEIIESFMEVRVRPECWKRLIDPNWPVNEWELNRTIESETIDNKWVLCAIAPDKAKVSAEELGLFDPERWQRRKLTHQLDALVELRNRSGRADEELDELIEHLCNRLSRELIFDAAVVDIYIQKVAFILRAGFPEKIRVRWVERIIANQLSDGGWDDRWLCFNSSSKLEFGFTTPPSNQHTTIQALTLLYLVKYRYPEQFGLK
jgi:hypothetical protein